MYDWLKTGELRAPTTWSIGILRGSSPLSLAPMDRNPVLTRRDVSDVGAAFVADPFMIPYQGRWFMFFEVMNQERSKGEIGLATSDDGERWSYEAIILREDFHLSYPFVFTDGDRLYMVPETSEASEIRLYEASDFPWKWMSVTTLARGAPFEDTTLINTAGRWWAFTSVSDAHSTAVRIYSSVGLMGPWIEHPRHTRYEGGLGRSGGRIVSVDGALLRFAQDSRRVYGEGVMAVEVKTLSMTEYRESFVDDGYVVGPSGEGWNAARMHTIDPHLVDDGGGWIACADGRGFSSAVSRVSRVLPLSFRPYEYPRASK